MRHTLKIGIDLDGTALAHRELFRELANAFKDRGHEIGIVTNHGIENQWLDTQYLVENGWPEPDFYVSVARDPGEVRDKKIRAVYAHSIDYLFDDFDTAYGQQGRVEIYCAEQHG